MSMIHFTSLVTGDNTDACRIAVPRRMVVKSAEAAIQAAESGTAYVYATRDRNGRHLSVVACHSPAGHVQGVYEIQLMSELSAAM